MLVRLLDNTPHGGTIAELLPPHTLDLLPIEGLHPHTDPATAGWHGEQRFKGTGEQRPEQRGHALQRKLCPAQVEVLRQRGFRFVEINPGERATLACNVLSLGKGRLLAIEENTNTNARLRHAGFDVRTFPASEIGINGGGGPTCLTRPILRS